MIKITDTTKPGIIVKPQNALKFDGSNDYVEIDEEMLIPDTDDFTMALWMTVDIPDGGHATLLAGDRASGYGWAWYSSTGFDNMKHRFRCQDESNTPLVGNDLRGQGWVHVVVMRDDHTFKLYEDNVEVDSQGVSSTYGTGISEFLTLGVLDGGRRHEGKIDDIRIYNRALDPQEITDLYNHKQVKTGLVGHWKFNEGEGSTAYDSSGNDNHGTLEGNNGGPDWVNRPVPKIKLSGN